MFGFFKTDEKQKKARGLHLRSLTLNPSPKGEGFFPNTFVNQVCHPELVKGVQYNQSHASTSSACHQEEIPRRNYELVQRNKRFGLIVNSFCKSIK